MPRVLIAEPSEFQPKAIAILSAHADVVLQETREAGMAAALNEYDVVWLRLGTRIEAAMLSNAKRCRIIATPVTGLDHIDLDACQAHGIRVVSLRGETEFLRTVRATAELTMGLLLSLMRHIPEAHSDVLRGHWNRDAFRGREIFGKRVALIGAGRLGSIVASYFAAFGASVVGYDPRQDFPADIMTRATSLKEALAEADIVSVHASLLPSTANLIGDAEFAAMKRGAFFLNTSRGGIVDEAALIRALDSGQLGGAAVDVVTGEPRVDATHPVVLAAVNRNNLLIVPHIGGNTFESFEKTEVFLAGRVVDAMRTLGLTQ